MTDFREDIFAFARDYMSINLRPHQLSWLDKIHHGGKRVLVLAPRGHGKSTIMLVYIIYRICKDTDIKILMASHVESLAKQQARAVQTFLELPKIQHDFDFSKGRPWSVSTFFLGGKIQPVMATVAARGGMVGKRFNVVVFDDLLSLENCMNETSRDNILNWIRGEVIPAIDPYDPEQDAYDKEKMIVIGTRKHQKDWYSQLLESRLYTKVLDVAYTMDEQGKHFLWPEKFTDEVLEMKKIELGPRLFAQEYMNEVTPSEGLELKREWLGIFDELPPRHCYKVVMGIDPSLGSKEQKASSLAVAVAAYDTRPEFHHVYVLELFKQKMSLLEQEKKILELVEKWQPVSTNVESVLVNTTFADRMIAQIPNANPVDYIHTRLKGTSEVSKLNRIKSLIGAYFEEGLVSLKNPNYNEQARAFIETEYVEFPEGETDLLDALNLACDLVKFDRMRSGPLIWTPAY